MPRSKRKSLLTHSRNRILERYGKLLDTCAIKEMSAMCRSGNHYCHLGKQSLTRSKIVLKYHGELYPVIYDKKRHCLIRRDRQKSR